MLVKSIPWIRLRVSGNFFSPPEAIFPRRDHVPIFVSPFSQTSGIMGPEAAGRARTERGITAVHKKQIIFDVDGTLIDTEYAVIRSLQDTLLELRGTLIPAEELTFSLGIPGKYALAHLGVADIPGTLSRWIDNMAKYDHTTAVFPGIRELLNRLTAAGCGIGVVTSRVREEFRADFTRFGILSYFTTVVCADDTERHKPDPAPLLAYMALTGCPPEDMLYVGDSIYDLQCAQGAGVPFALADWGAKGRVEAPLAFASPADLMEALDTARGKAD